MTVSEPTPDVPRAGSSILRRVSFAFTAVALTATFALSLAGIASTQGSIEPSGPAATLAAQQNSSDSVADRHDCPHGDRRSRSASGRV
jgi:hypothetical protein